MFYILIVLAAASRLLPHPPNVACIAALGLFAGCYMRSRWALAVPVAAMLLSDLAGQWLKLPGLGFYNPVSMVMVYAGLSASAGLGRWLSAHRSFGTTAMAAVASSTVFFLLSNFGVWLSGAYPENLAGLTECYTLALPFYKYTLVGDLLYTTVMFGTFEWYLAKNRHASAQRCHANTQ